MNKKSQTRVVKRSLTQKKDTMKLNLTKSILYSVAVGLAALGLLAMPVAGSHGWKGESGHLASNEDETDWALANKDGMHKEEVDWTLAKNKAEEEEIDWTLASKDGIYDEEVDWILA